MLVNNYAIKLILWLPVGPGPSSSLLGDVNSFVCLFICDPSYVSHQFCLLLVHFCNLPVYVVHLLYAVIYFSLISDLCFCMRIDSCLEDRMPAFIISLESSPTNIPPIFSNI